MRFKNFSGIKTFVKNTIILISLYLPSAQAMEPEDNQKNSTPTAEQLAYKEKQDKLTIPQGDFQIFPKEVVIHIYGQSKSRFPLSQTCKSFYPWLEAFPLEYSVTLPKDFSKPEDYFNIPFIKLCPPTVLNLYYLPLFGSHQCPSPLYPLMDLLLKEPQGTVKTLKVSKLVNKPSIEKFKEKGVKVETLPFSILLDKRPYLKDSELDLMFEFDEILVPWHIYPYFPKNHDLPQNKDLLMGVLSAYNSIKKILRWDDQRTATKIILLQFQSDPKRLSMIEKLFTNELYELSCLDSTFAFIEKIKYLNTDCFVVLKDFISSYNKYYNQQNINNIPVVFGSKRAYLVAAKYLFADLMEIRYFEQEKQVDLLNLLFSLLTFDHIHNSCQQHQTLRLYDAVKNALVRVNKYLFPLSQNERKEFLNDLKATKKDINLLEEESAQTLEESLKLFREKNPKFVRDNAMNLYSRPRWY